MSAVAVSEEVLGKDLLLWPRKLDKRRVRIIATVEGDPISKGRPRFAINKNGRTYTPKTTREAENVVRAAIQVAGAHLQPDGETAFGVRVSFHTRTWQRRDVDNMAKLVFDACTGVVWEDDSQVNELFARCIRIDPRPRTEIVIYSLGVQARPVMKCERCAKLFRIYASWPNRRFCSQRCFGKSLERKVTVECEYCGNPVVKRESEMAGRNTHFCNKKCHYAARQVAVECGGCGKEMLIPKHRKAANRDLVPMTTR